ncbi:MAG: hypothetical protein J5781_05305, partial [Clostridia bacterium]|nr:hypothetical protein [Clostridia bacterium]
IDYTAHDDDGNVIYNSLGEPVILHYSEVQDEGCFVMTTVNMDEVYGLDGTEASVEEIGEKMAANSAAKDDLDVVAYAGNITESRSGSQLARNTNYGTGTASASGSHTGYNTEHTASCTCTCTLTGGQFQRWINQSTSYVGCNISSVSRSQSGNTRSSASGSQGYGGKSGNNHYWYANCTGYASRRECADSTVNCSVSAYFSFYHNYTSSISFSGPFFNLSTPGWAPSRAANTIAVQATSSISYNYFSRLATSQNTTGGSWANKDSSEKSASVSIKNHVSCLSRVYMTVTDQANTSATRWYTASDLRIDNVKPTTSGFRVTKTNTYGGTLIQNGSSTSYSVYSDSGLTGDTTVYVWIGAADPAATDNSGRTGIASVTGSNAHTGAGGTFSSKDGYYYFAVAAKNANGRWDITVKDGAGNSTSASCWVSAIDCAAPTYNNDFTVDKSATKSSATESSNYWTVKSAAYDKTGDWWSNAPLLCKMTFADTTGWNTTDGNTGAIFKRNGIRNVVVSFTYKGVAYTMGSNGSNLSGTQLPNTVGLKQLDIGNTVKTQGDVTANGRIMWATVSFYLPTDTRTGLITNLKVTAYDHAGHYITTGTLSAGNAKVDVVAPKVTSIAVNSGSSLDSFASGNITLTVKAIDYAQNDNTAGYFTKGQNNSPAINTAGNGSGVYGIYVYVKNTRTNAASGVTVIGKKENDTSWSNIGANNAEKTATFTINWDSLKILSKYSNLNANDVPTLYAVAVDWAGNRSDAWAGKDNYANEPGSGNYKAITANCRTFKYGVKASATVNDTNNISSSDSNNAKAGASRQWSGFYIASRNYENGVNSIKVYRDSYKPVVRVYTDSGCTNCVADSGEGYNYTYAWSKASQLINGETKPQDITFYVKVWCGDSGGTLQRTTNGSTVNVGSLNNFTSSNASYTASGNTAYFGSSAFPVTIYGKDYSGSVAHTIKFTNKAGVSVSVTVTTQTDVTGPTIELKGFASSMRNATNVDKTTDYISETDLANTWTKSAYYAVFKLTDAQSGVDTASKKYGKSNALGNQSSAVNVTFTFSYSYTDSNNKTHIYSFSWNKDTNATYFSKFGNDYYYQAPMFQLSTLEKLTNGGTSGSRKFKADDGLWDVQTIPEANESDPNRYLKYTFAAKDFIGNETKFATRNGLGKKTNGTTNDLVYKVDPFPLSATVTMYTVTEGNWVKDGSVPKYDTIEPKMVSYYGFDWTKDYVVLKVKYNPGLSKVTSHLLWHNPTAGASFVEDASSIGLSPANGNERTATETWFCLSPEKQKNIVAQIQCTNKAGADPAVESTIDAPGYSNGAEINVKQDKTPPKVTAVFFSDKPDITSYGDSNIALYFTYRWTIKPLGSNKPSDWDTSYKDYLYLDSNNGQYYKNNNPTWANNRYYSKQEEFGLDEYSSKRYSNGMTELWTLDKMYMYVVVNDKDLTANAEGSGVYFSDPSKKGLSKVQVNYFDRTGAGVGTVTWTENQDLVPVGAIGESYSCSYLFRSSGKWYGYERYDDDFKCWIDVVDYIGNETLIGTKDNSGKKAGTALGGMSSGGKDQVTGKQYKAFKMFPIVDGATPTLELKGTNEIAYSSLTENKKTTYSFPSGKGDGNRLAGTEWDGNGNAKKYTSGEYSGQVIRYITSATSITVNLDINCGISGYSVYLRQRDFNEKLSDYSDKSLTAQSGGALPGGYNISGNYWGKYENGSMTYGTAQTSKDWSYFRTQSNPGIQHISVVITGTAITNRFDVLVVLGNGKYYLYEMGDVIVDNAPPELNRHMTIFTLADTDPAFVYGGTINYNELSKIWTDDILSTDSYTNGKISAYFNIEDSGIGIRTIKYDNTVNPAVDDKTAYGLKSLNGNTGATLVGKDLVYVGDAVLEKVKISNVPVAYIGTYSTGVIWADYIKTITVANNGGNCRLTISYIDRVGRANVTVETKIPYTQYTTAGSKVTNKTETVTYYRYTSSNSATISPAAADGLSTGKSNALHVMSGVKEYTPHVDLNDATSTFTMSYYTAARGTTVDESTANKESYNGLNEETGKKTYARSRVDATLQLQYGNSGIGSLTLRHIDLSTSNARDYDVALPTVSVNESNKYVISFYNASGTWTSVATAVTYADNISFTFKVRKDGNKYYWTVTGVNGVSVSSEISSSKYAALIAYNMQVDVSHKISGKSTTTITFSLPKADYEGKFEYVFKNGVDDAIKSPMARNEDSKYPALTGGSGYKYVYIDVTAPTIDTNSGTLKELMNANAPWSAIAKLLSVSVTDNFELGMDQYEKINDVVLRCTVSNNESYEWKMLNNFIQVKGQVADDLYRPTDATYSSSGKKYDVTKFVYCEYNKVYTIEAYDKAGNKASVSFTPKVDTGEARITELHYYTGSGSAWTPYVPGTWTSQAVKIVGKATYAANASGYKLQYRAAQNDSFTDDNWTTMSVGTGYTVLSGGGTNGNVEFSIVLGEGVNAYYQFYELRVLTGAQYNEFYSNGATTNDEGDYLQVARTTFTNATGETVTTPVKNGTRYWIGDVTHTITLQGAVEVADIAPLGRTTETKKKGVRVDKVTPTVSGAVNSSSTAYGSGSGNTWNCGVDYVNDKVYITISSTQVSGVSGLNYASGNAFFFTTDVNAAVTDYGKWTKLVPTGTKGVMMKYNNGSYSNESAMSSDFTMAPTEQGITHERYAASITYTIATSKQNTGYKFYVVSGAGLSSAVYTVSGVKIDINTPTVSVSAVDTYQEFTRGGNGLFGLTDAAAFGSNNYQVKRYSSGSAWTKKNGVILKIEIGNVGYSGAKLELKEELMGDSNYVVQKGYTNYFDLSYEEFESHKETTGFYVVYVAIGENGDRRITAKVVENAHKNGDVNDHKTSAEIAFIVKIDNTTPFLSVKSIASAVGGNNGRAANWEYAESGDKWYVEEITVTLKVGMIEKSGAVYTYNANKPYSGYTVYYNKASYLGDNGRTITSNTWIDVDTLTYSGDTVTFTVYGLLEQCKYRFKVVSGTEMEFIIDEDLKDNTASQSVINTVYYNAKALNKVSLQRELGMLTGHNVDGEDSGDMCFTFNVDTNRYNYTYKARLLTAWSEDNPEYNNNTGDLVDYVIKKGDWSNENGGAFTVVTPDVEFKHGDRIRVEYASKNYTVNNRAYAYYHNFTEIENSTDERSGQTVIVSNNDNTMFEANGRFDVTFGKYNLKMTADYGAELPVTYGATTFYMQYNEKPTVTTGSVAYSWKNNNTTLNKTPALSYQYYNLELNGSTKVYTGVPATSIKTVDGNSDYFDVGAYYVVPSIPLYDVFGDYSVGDTVGANVYVYENGAYVRPTTNKYQADTVYYKRNGAGNFRVAVLDGGTEERQEFVIKYFSEDATVEIVANNPGYYTIGNLTDFKYIDKDYYAYDKATDELTRCSYLKDTNNKAYKLMSDFTLTPTTFDGFVGTFLAELDGNDKTITLALNSVLEGSYGIFDDFAGNLHDLNVVASEPVSVYLTGNEEIKIGLLAKTMSGGRISNVSVTADFNVRQNMNRTAASYIGGIAAKADNATIGSQSEDKAVFTDIRIKNNGEYLNNVNVGGMFGYTNGTDFEYAIAYGDVTVYNVNSVNVGIVTAEGSVGNHAGLYYFKSNTFLNDATVNTIGTDFASASFGIGKTYDFFIAHEVGDGIDVALGAVDIAGKMIRNRVLDRVYSDFGFDTQTGYANGLGTTGSPLQVSTVAQLAVIDEYVNLSYKLMNSIEDMSAYRPIAIHKVFNGVFDGATPTGSYYVLSGFGNGIESYSAPYFGFFGQLNGTVKNIVFNKFDIRMNYTGTSAFSAGVIAGKTGGATVINNVIVIGLTSIVSESAPVYVGGLLGSTSGGTMTDVVNMNNISVTAPEIKAGGIIGKANETVVARDSGRVYSFGRVETSGRQVETGAILGNGTIRTQVISPSVYGLLDNTYINGVVASDNSIGNGSTNGSAPSMVKFTDATMRSTSFSSGISPFTFLFDPNNGWYPLEGEGLASNPFKVSDEEDFKNINLALYACYQITRDITFTAFETIGDGLNFTGTIDGTGEAGIGAEESNIVTLKNVTKPLVYNVMGTVQNLGINVNYTHVIQTNETLYYGAVAVRMMEGGNIKNITIDGNVNIYGVDSSTTAYVSGFVAVVSGGTIDNSVISDNSKLRNNISALTINITGVGTVYAGGYAASVERGGATFSFGIANGNINIEDCDNV